jgi:hypothetical protein
MLGRSSRRDGKFGVRSNSLRDQSNSLHGRATTGVGEPTPRVPRAHQRRRMEGQHDMKVPRHGSWCDGSSGAGLTRSSRRSFELGEDNARASEALPHILGGYRRQRAEKRQALRSDGTGCTNMTSGELVRDTTRAGDALSPVPRTRQRWRVERRHALGWERHALRQIRRG